MTDFEKAIKILKEIGSQKLMESTFSLVQYAELVEAVCKEYGKEKVMNALYNLREE